MTDLVRLSLSMDRALLRRLEKMVRAGRYENRSEFIRDMIRDRFVNEEWDANRKVVGTITLIYKHHTHHLEEKLTDLQHRYHHVILATTHVHLDKELCVESIIARGRAGTIREISDLLGQQKGVLHSALSASSTGEDLV